MFVEGKSEEDQEEDEGIEGEADEEIDGNIQEPDDADILEEVDDTNEDDEDEENDIPDNSEFDARSEAADDSAEEGDEMYEEIAGIPGVNEIDDNSAEPLEEVRIDALTLYIVSFLCNCLLLSILF